jgi:hypothetical protein
MRRAADAHPRRRLTTSATAAANLDAEIARCIERLRSSRIRRPRLAAAMRRSRAKLGRPGPFSAIHYPAMSPSHNFEDALANAY